MNCTKCETPIPLDREESADWFQCRGCQSALWLEVFPAYYKAPPESRPAQAILIEGESSCFFHAEKRADTVCDACGRFLCSLCDLDFDGRHLCPQCLGSQKEKGRLTQLENKRVLHDNVALATAVLTSVMFFAWVITAPIIFYLVIRHWNSPGSLLPRSRWRFAVAALIGVGQLIGGIAFYYSIYNS